MTPSQLRQGAALVRALVEGDETARGPLSDFLLEYGQPWSESVPSTVIQQLRGNGRYSLKAEPRDYSYVVSGVLRNGDDVWVVRFGGWPAWAWDGTSATAET